jgi:hypothetical protein
MEGEQRVGSERLGRQYNPAAPEGAVVEQYPRLFRKAYAGFLLLNSRPRREGSEDIVHNGAAGTSEDDDPVEDEEDVIPAEGEPTSGRVVVGDAEELLGVVAGDGEEGVGEEEGGEEVQRNAWQMGQSEWSRQETAREIVPI